MRNTYTKSDLLFSLIVIISGITILTFDIFLYPSFLPKVITTANSQWIEQSSYVFYIVFILGILIEVYGIYRILQYLTFKVSNNDDLTFKQVMVQHSSKLTTTKPDIKKQQVSVFKIILDILNDKKYFRFFLPITLAYGFLYAMISGTLIIRPEGGISHISGIVDFPSVIMMQYGPIGYVPTISIYLSDSFGIFIIPLNLIVTIIISSLVGFNAVSTIYAYANYHSTRKRKESHDIATSSAIKNNTQFMGVLGATTSLFAACPTCASFYIFNILAGSLATTVAAFTVTYYALFIMTSIPLLVIAPFITAFNIKKMKNSYTSGQCSIRK